MNKLLITITLLSGLGLVSTFVLAESEIGNAFAAKEAKEKTAAVEAGVLKADDSLVKKAEPKKDEGKDPVIANIIKVLTPLFGGEAPDNVTKSGAPGMYEITVGTEVIYVNNDAKYMFVGEVIDIESKRNLTSIAKKRAEEAYKVKRKEIIAKQDVSKTISFKAKDEKQVLTIFTDIDCPYCSKLHNDVPALNKKGITVNYYLFPRSGPNTPSFAKAISAWCADDNKEALTKAKERKAIPNKTCDNPVVEQYTLGRKIGVTGTPALITEDGTLIPGYMPVNILVERLGLK
ncbi:MAG: DsbC family protein [Thiotrichaceae bacterium]|nr:DsbC family protein [Thiotrichaceae bacterium]